MDDRWTWGSPDGVTKRQIDYILATEDLREQIEEAGVVTVIPVMTDHRLVQCKLTCGREPRSDDPPPPSIDRAALRDPRVAQAYKVKCEELCSRIDLQTQDPDALFA